MTPLSPFEVKAALAGLPGWRHERAGEYIALRVRTESFATAFTLAARIALMAERAAHHPEITIAWGRLDIALTTHSAKGITRADIELAETISRWMPSNG